MNTKTNTFKKLQEYTKKTQKTGCMDKLSPNYNPNADLPCSPPESCCQPYANWYVWNDSVNMINDFYSFVDPPSCSVLCSTGTSDVYGNSWNGLDLNCYGRGACPPLKNQHNLNKKSYKYYQSLNSTGGIVYEELLDDGNYYKNSSCNYDLPKSGGERKIVKGFTEIYCCCG